jgi:chromate transporter
MSWEVWLSLFTHFMLLSLLAVGGAITTASDMQRYVVEKQGWLSDMQFTSCIAIAQAAPGPNVLFIPLIGWQIGMQMGGTYVDAAVGLLGTFIGIMVPSSTLTFAATRWLQRNANHVIALASKASLAPISIALLLATSWLLASSHDNAAKDGPLWIFTITALLLAWKTKMHPLLILGAGAVLGMLGVI